MSDFILMARRTGRCFASKSERNDRMNASRTTRPGHPHEIVAKIRRLPASWSACLNCPTSPPTSVHSNHASWASRSSACGWRAPFLLRSVQPPVADVEGRTVRELRRIGKRIAIGVDGELWLVLHLMIAGRLHWRPRGAKLAGRQNLAAFDFPGGALVLTEAGTKRRASLHVLSGDAGFAFG